MQIKNIFIIYIYKKYFLYNEDRNGGAIMEIGIIGLGKMGLNLASNLKDHGYRTKGLDLSEQARLAARREGIETYETISQMVASFTGKRVIWLMLPAGKSQNRY